MLDKPKVRARGPRRSAALGATLQRNLLLVLAFVGVATILLHKRASVSPTVRSMPSPVDDSTSFLAPVETDGDETPSFEQSPSLTSQERVRKLGTSLSRPFPPKPVRSWCTKTGYAPYDQANHEAAAVPHKYESPTGLLFNRVPKAASSTLAGVVHRIARENGNCDLIAEHVYNRRGAGFVFGNRNRETSFLFGSVRDPTARAVSRVYFHHVSRRGEVPTDENVLSWLNETDPHYGAISAGRGGFQLNYLALEPLPQWTAFVWTGNGTGEIRDPDKVERNVRRILDGHDFVAVVERMDESLVALRLLLGAKVEDILVLDSHVRGSYDHVVNARTPPQGRCFKILRPVVSDVVREYLASKVWRDLNYGDYLLHAAANASLDRTIYALGRDRFQGALEEYRTLKDEVHKVCESRAVFPCTKDGEVTPLMQRIRNCYSDGEGCGHPCIDEFLRTKREG